MSVSLTRNFFGNARGLKFKDTASVTWSLNANTNELSATASGGGGGGVSSVALADGSSTAIYTISGSPVTSTGTLTFTLSTQSANKIFAGPTSGGAAQPTFRSLVSGDIPALSYVTSVALADGSSTAIYAITGSPVNSSGTLTFTLNTQAAHAVFAGPSSGPAAQPVFRALVAGDIPALAYVTSVALADGSSTAIYTISGSPVTASGTLTFTLNTQAANVVFAGPTTGAAAQPTFRALVAADVPSSILPGSFSGFANPSAVVGLSAVNGSATTAMRSDGAPALDQTITPTWTGIHKFSATGGGLSSAVELIAAAPSILFQNSGGAANGKNWDFGSPSSTTLRLRAVDDAGNTFRNVMQITRSGVAITAQEYGNTTDNPVHTFDGGIQSGTPTGANKGTGTVNMATGIFLNGAPVSPSANNAPVTIVNGQWIYQYQQILLAGTDRMTLAGTARAIVTRAGTDFEPGPQGEAFENLGLVVLGVPKTPLVNFVVPTEYICTFRNRLIMRGSVRGNLQGTANLVVSDDFATRSRVVMAGTGY